jgi:hypothetical protein
MTLIYILTVGNIIFSLVIWSVFKKEQGRNRILQSFIAGLVRSVSDYVSTTDKACLDEVPEHNTKLPIPYKKILGAVEYEMLKDISMPSVQKHEQWLRESRQLFTGEKHGNDGFVFMNYDLFDDLIAHWHSGELVTPKEKAYLSEEIIVSKDNAGELQGEIAMYKDLLSGQLESKNFKKETIDNQLFMMFSHLKQEYRDTLKQEILKRI